MKRYLVLLLTLAVFTVLLVGCAARPGQQQPQSSEPTKQEVKYPTKTIQLLVPYKAGGATDTSARIIAQFLEEQLGVPVVVVNQTAAGGMVACETVRTAAPDGYTLLYEHLPISTRPQTGLYEYTYKDFTPISTGSVVNQTILCDINAPWNSLKDFVADAKANPGKYSFGMQTGGSSHFHAAALMNAAGIELKLLEAGGEAEKLAALQGGHLHLIQATVGAAREYAAAKKMKVLAVSAPERDPLAPDFPTAREQGYDIVIQSQHYILGPKGLPEDVVKVLSEALAEFGKSPENIEKLNKVGQNWVYKTPEETRQMLERELEMVGKLAEKLGLKK